MVRNTQIFLSRRFCRTSACVFEHLCNAQHSSSPTASSIAPAIDQTLVSSTTVLFLRSVVGFDVSPTASESFFLFTCVVCGHEPAQTNSAQPTPTVSSQRTDALCCLHWSLLHTTVSASLVTSSKPSCSTKMLIVYRHLTSCLCERARIEHLCALGSPRPNMRHVFPRTAVTTFHFKWSVLLIQSLVLVNVVQLLAAGNIISGVHTTSIPHNVCVLLRVILMHDANLLESTTKEHRNHGLDMPLLCLPTVSVGAVGLDV